MVKREIINRLNNGTDPKSLGFERAATDAFGNEYWCRRQGAVTVRLNRHEADDGTVTWDDDVEGWENPS
jgi:hypothetical protein